MTVFAALGFLLGTEKSPLQAHTLIRQRELLSRQPDSEGPNVRVWTIVKDDILRINLVEMSGELRLHMHPDAAHSLMVLEGSVRVQAASEQFVLGKGDFVSFPAGQPHKYWSLSETSLLVSMDAPYYRQSIALE